MESSVKVVGNWVSPFVHRVRWALKLKGVDYEYVEEDLSNKTPLLSQINPIYGKVPVLVHHGNPLPESAIILEYIDEVWSQHTLLPHHPYERAQARFWAKFADQKLLVSGSIVLYSEGEDQERAANLNAEYLEKIEEKIKGNRFFGGEEVGYMDLVMGFVAYMFPVWGEAASVEIVDPSRFPAIAAWTSNFLNHPVIKKSEYLPPRDKILAYYKLRRKQMIPLFASHTDFGKKVWNDVVR